MKYLLTICFLSFFAFSCTEEVAVKEIKKPAKKVKNLNPNGDSELALLMRLMADETTSIQKAINKGEAYGELSDYSSLHTAIPTEEGMNEGAFQGFATVYLAKIADFKTCALTSLKRIPQLQQSKMEIEIRQLDEVQKEYHLQQRVV